MIHLKRINGTLYAGVPLEALETPRDGNIVYANRYWMVLDGQALFYFDLKTQTAAPQCHKDEAFIKRGMPQGAVAQFVRFAYVPSKYTRIGGR